MPDGPCEIRSEKLPWWTWIAPALICHLGTQLSLHFSYAPGVSFLYLPIPLGIVLAQWWGPRVLPGVYVNALFCAGLWGLSQVAWWPVYALPETIAVGLSWYLFQHAAGAKCWMATPRDLLCFLLCVALPAAFVDGLQVPGQLLISGELSRASFWATVGAEWTATFFSCLGVSLPVLYFLTAPMERKGLSRTLGAETPPLVQKGVPYAWAPVEFGTVMALAFVFSWILSPGVHWIAFAVLALWAGLRFGLGAALAVNAWVVFLTLLLPVVLPGQSPILLGPSSDLTSLHLGLALVCAISSITGSTTGSLRKELHNRRIAEAELRESEFLFRSQFDLGNIGIALISPDRRWLRVNKKLLAMFGYTDAEMKEKTWSELTHPDDIEESVAQFQRAMSGEIDSYEMEKRYIRKDGSVMRAHVTVACFRDGDNIPQFNIASLYDVSEQWRLEEQLRQAQKMEAVGQLAGGVAHDFNNLLQAILGCGDMALEQTAPDSPIHNDLKEIVSTAHRAAALVRQLLAFSRRQMLELKNIPFDDVVHDITSMLRRLIREDITLHIDTCSGNALVCADRGQLEQVLMNLCVNARDAISGTGEITIRTLLVRRPADDCSLDRDWVRLSVIDTGCGMDDGTLQHLFDPFFTTKGPGEGSGLGLATVYGIARQHNAIIEVSSAVGQGSVFHIFFPVSEGLETPREVAPVQIHRGGSETILLAEDDAVIRQLAMRFLQGAGYTVVTVEDGAAAMEVLQDRINEFDLVMLDVVMPKLGGRAVYDFIQSRRPSLPVLFVSGYNAGQIHSDFVLHAGFEFIQKPYRRLDLLQRIREILGTEAVELVPPGIQ